LETFSTALEDIVFKNYSSKKEIVMKVHRKLFIGPMSKSVVDAAMSNGIREKVGLIPSRRQIEDTKGYVNDWSTNDFLKYTDGQIIRCRDHAGPLQGKEIDDGIDSLTADCKGFEIIHIDPWRKEKDIDLASSLTCDLIRRCHSLNSNVLYEIGTEQSIRPYSVSDLEKFVTKVNSDLGHLFEKVLYCVIQGGTHVKGIENAGKLDEKSCKSMIDMCKNFGLLSKEHNGDYLSQFEVSRRFELGLNAINIAPEIGRNETDFILSRCDKSEINRLFNICLISRKWEKWLPPGFEAKTEEDKIMLIRSCGHYVFSHPDVVEIKRSLLISENEIIDMHRKRISDLLCTIG